MSGELCPAAVRGFSSNAATFVAFSSIFLLVKLFPGAAAAAGLRAVFGAFAAVCAANAAFCLAFLPETAGKTLAELEAMFGGGGHEEEEEGDAAAGRRK